MDVWTNLLMAGCARRFRLDARAGGAAPGPKTGLGGCWQETSWPHICASNHPSIHLPIHVCVRLLVPHICAYVRAFVHLPVRPSICASARLSLPCLTYCASTGPTLPCARNVMPNGVTLCRVGAVGAVSLPTSYIVLPFPHFIVAYIYVSDLVYHAHAVEANEVDLLPSSWYMGPRYNTCRIQRMLLEIGVLERV
eukprot:COSAG05_NODE_7040_length_863_cov_2.069372_1_plen_195_part_00